MRIVTWNINSLKARREHVEAFLDDVAPTVLCMQELKMDDPVIDRSIFESRGYHLITHGQRTYNGVAIASRIPMKDTIIGLPEVEEDQRRFTAATIDGVRIVNLYCPQGQNELSDKFQYKLRFYDALIDWIAREHDPAQPFILTGDLNIAPRAVDIFDPEQFRNVPSFHPFEHERWARLLEWGLVDAAVEWFEDGEYTFWDYRGGSFERNLGMRIDHFLVTPPVLARVQGAHIHRDQRGKERASDHAPVELILGE
ncbi:MAG: exodeoxyribonuclease III [Proteobacteria bacterium]|nr:exodeoxyribonuclease III [Pseudomonadota bacterium]MCP4916244.1 exodeoxyribonuclease III [Pseudomonadota bacterium]